MAPLPQRQTAWRVLDAMISIAPLDRLPALADVILSGKVRGRMVIDLQCP